MNLKQILIPQNLKRGYYRRGHGLQIYEWGHIVYLEVKTYTEEGNVIEILRCTDRRQGLFKLLTRQAETRVPISSLVLRHQNFPLGCTVRLKKHKPKLLLPPLDK